MTMMSLTAYAETHAATRQAATKWRDRGYLVMHGDQVDVEASDVKMEGGAKGRFRVKAHGGRRTTGERGVIDRPGMGYNRGVKTAPPAPSPWCGWSKISNPNTLAADVKAWIEDGDSAAVAEALDAIEYSAWEDFCTAAGWQRWPALAAPQIAQALGMTDGGARVLAVLQPLVDARLQALDIDLSDLADDRLRPR